MLMISFSAGGRNVNTKENFRNRGQFGGIFQNNGTRSTGRAIFKGSSQRQTVLRATEPLIQFFLTLNVIGTMFASVCSGRPVQLAQQVDSNKYAINLSQGSKISHVCIFLLPEAQLPREYKALIYFKLPGESEFKLLGSISQDKQSSIFRLKNKDEVDVDEDSMIEEIDDQDVVTVGISIETAEVAQQLEDSQFALVKKTITTRPVITEPLSTSEKTQLAAKVVKNAYNYLSSFVDNNGNVNIKYFDSWWNKFQAKLKNDDKFLDSD